MTSVIVPSPLINIPLDNEMQCTCGFSTLNGNHLGTYYNILIQYYTDSKLYLNINKYFEKKLKLIYILILLLLYFN
jgi:hypothetical protein